MNKPQILLTSRQVLATIIYMYLTITFITFYKHLNISIKQLYINLMYHWPGTNVCTIFSTDFNYFALQPKYHNITTNKMNQCSDFNVVTVQVFHL